MKRNLDLVRDLLLTIQDLPPDRNVIHIDGIRREVVYEHLYVMHQAGLIEAVVHENGSNFDVMVYPIRLTWAGHEFIDAATSSTRWEMAKNITSQLGGVTLELMKKVLVSLAEQQIQDLLR